MAVSVPMFDMRGLLYGPCSYAVSIATCRYFWNVDALMFLYMARAQAIFRVVISSRYMG